MTQVVFNWPARLKRLAIHLWYPFFRLVNAKKVHERYPHYRPHFWFLGLLFLLLDLLFIPDLYDVLSFFIKRSARPLHQLEREEAESIFSTSIHLDNIIIDQQARVGTKKYSIAYVSFYTINSWGPISLPTFIHELVHIWQYEQFGAAYIALALQAQFSEMKYDYGGTSVLINKHGIPFSLAFNFEQQAEIIEDYYRSKKNLPLQWSEAGHVANLWLAYWAQERLSG